MNGRSTLIGAIQLLALLLTLPQEAQMPYIDRSAIISYQHLSAEDCSSVPSLQLEGDQPSTAIISSPRHAC